MRNQDRWFVRHLLLVLLFNLNGQWNLSSDASGRFSTTVQIGYSAHGKKDL